jgi:hypothetical protein
MPAHLVASRGEIADRHNPEPCEQAMRIEAEGVAQTLEAEDARGAPALFATEPVCDLDEFSPVLTLVRLDVAKVASNRVLEDGHQQLHLTFKRVISPDQVGILRGHQDSRFG